MFESNILNNFDENNNYNIDDNQIFEQFWRWELEPKHSCYVYITMWIVYSIFLRNQWFESLIDWVNFWWDTDSFWAILWNMIWAYNWNIFEKKYIDWNQRKEEIYKLWNEFIKKFVKN